MKIIDGFLFNGEFQILKLRLEIMYPYVDEFVIIESTKTFTDLPKSILFEDRKDEFAEYLPKVKYFKITELPNSNLAWDKEFYLRNQIIKNIVAEENDVVMISDVDEILNMPFLLKRMNPSKVSIIELPCFYGFINLKSTEVIKVTIVSPYKNIKDRDIGNRIAFSETADEIIINNDEMNGGHFTYLFGFETDRYIEKIKGFSHQEFNNERILNENKIYKSMKYGIDFLERWKFNYSIISLEKESIPEFYKNIMNNADFKNFILKKSKLHCLRKIFFSYSIKSYRQYKLYLFRLFLSKIKQKIVSFLTRKQ